MCVRYQASPRESHHLPVKSILTYLVHTPLLGLWYPKEDKFDLLGYTDADWDGDKVDRKSTSGSCQFLGSSLVSWHSKKKKLCLPLHRRSRICYLRKLCYSNHMDEANFEGLWTHLSI